MPPKRKRPRLYSEKDVGRIVAYARNDGADDIKLIAYILQSFGLRNIQCLGFKILDILNTAVFLTAILAVLKGILSVSKGLKILALGKKSRLTLNIIEQLLPARFNRSLAAFLLWTGSVELAAGTLIIFFTSIANNVALYLLMKGVCEEQLDPLKVDIESLDVKNLFEDISDAVTVLETIINDNL
jgi:kynureninase